MTTTRDRAVVIDNFAGLNRRDGGDRVQDNQFLKLQNWYPLTKFLFYKRNGSTEIVDVSAIPLASKIVAAQRFSDVLGQKYTIAYCEPDATVFPVPTGTLTLSETGTDGDIFGGGAVSALEYGWSWVGADCESAVVSGGSITPSVNTRKVAIQTPAFPAGVSSANIFKKILAKWTYLGTVYSAAETLYDKDPLTGVALNQANVDNAQLRMVSVLPGGSLKKGKYFIATTWYCVDTANGENNSYRLGYDLTTSTLITVDVPQDDMKIVVRAFMGGGASANGSNTVRYFIGTNLPTKAPLHFVGTNKIVADMNTATRDFTISALPVGGNASSRPVSIGGVGKRGVFVAASNTEWNGGLNARSARVPFLVKIDGSTVTYINSTRSSAGDNDSTTNTSDRMTAANGSAVCMAPFYGLAYVANGTNRLWTTDGYHACMQYEDYNAAQPIVVPRKASWVGSFRSQLVVIDPDYRNQLFGSNALQPDNFSSGGVGTSYRFVTVGDPYGDAIKAANIFGFTSGTEGPRSLLIAFKKNSIWVLDGIPDLTSGIASSMDQITGRVGCSAQATIVNTPIGLIFLGTDGDVYMTRGSGEPYRIGGSVRSLLAHLADSDALMALCNASFHNGFYKLSYPSTPSSTSCDAELWGDMRTEQGVPITWCGPHTMASSAQQAFGGEGDSAERVGITSDGTKLVKLDDPATFQDLGQPIESVLETKIFRFGDPMHDKRYMLMMLDAYYDTLYAHSVTLEAFADDQYSQYNVELSAGSGIWDSSAWDVGLWGNARFSPIIWEIGPTPLIGRTFQGRITHSNNAQFILAAIGINVQPERRRITP